MTMVCTELWCDVCWDGQGEEKRTRNLEILCSVIWTLPNRVLCPKLMIPLYGDAYNNQLKWFYFYKEDMLKIQF